MRAGGFVARTDADLREVRPVGFYVDLIRVKLRHAKASLQPVLWRVRPGRFSLDLSARPTGSPGEAHIARFSDTDVLKPLDAAAKPSRSPGCAGVELRKRVAVSVNFLGDRFRHIPGDLVFYAVLALLDFGLSLYAFGYGHPELNPVLADAEADGLFNFMKLALTLLIVCIGVHLWRKRVARAIVTIANAVMVSLIIYHVSIHMV